MGDGNSEIESDYYCDAYEYWDDALDSRIDLIGNAPPAQEYSGAITSSIQALDKEKQVLQDAIDIIRGRCSSEEQALHDALHALYEHRACEEHAIESSIAAIHYHRNALIPIARLHPEILSRIFVFHAQLEWKWLGAVLTSTRVCKRWREIGLSCPALWSYIDYEDCRSVEWMATMIQCSCSVPLSLIINDRAKMDPRKTALVTNNLHRFKSLELLIRNKDADSFLELFRKPASLLQHLQISYFRCAAFAFPAKFLGGSAPNLRHIKLTTNSHVPWTSGLFENLITLEVSGGERRGPDTPSLEMLLSALARMPALETLTLCNCFPQPPSATAAYVDLPNLKQLRVTGPLKDATYFLGKITINASAAVRLCLRCLHVSKEDVEQLFMIFPSQLCTTALPTVRALKFAWQACFSFKVDVWTVQPDAKVTSSQNTKIKLIFNWDSPRTRGITPLDLTWTCFAALASPQLSSFRIMDHELEWDANIWRKVARVSPDLRRLAPGSEARCVELCEALRPPDSQDLAQSDCCFPALSYLELDVPYNCPVPTTDEEVKPLAEVLSQSLSVRAAIGCSTPELVFISFWGDSPEGWSEPFTAAVPGIIVREDDGWNKIMVRLVLTLFLVY